MKCTYTFLARWAILAKLGFHCIGARNDLPEAALNDGDLENYCFTILGNEPLEDFQNAVEKSAICFDVDLVKCALGSLKSSDNHMLPEWLNKQELISKLDTLVNFK